MVVCYLSILTADMGCPLHHIQKLFYNGQPQTGFLNDMGTLLIHTLECIKQIWNILFPYSNPGIGYVKVKASKPRGRLAFNPEFRLYD